LGYHISVSVLNVNTWTPASTYECIQIYASSSYGRTEL
jgi:hypothetical protein